VAEAKTRKRKLPKILTRDEARALLAAPNVRYPTGLRNRCMLELMYRAGLRVSEVCALKPRDVDLAKGTIRIHDGKGGDGTAYFDAETLRLLIDQWKGRRRTLPKSDFLFCTLVGGKVSTRYMQQMTGRMAKRAGITARCTPHTLRHTFATELLDEGANIRQVQEALRHSDVSTTMIYTHVLDTQLRSIIRKRKR
jgi:site-specific recombinase XerD